MQSAHTTCLKDISVGGTERKATRMLYHAGHGDVRLCVVSQNLPSALVSRLHDTLSLWHPSWNSLLPLKVCRLWIDAVGSLRAPRCRSCCSASWRSKSSARRPTATPSSRSCVYAGAFLLTWCAPAVLCFWPASTKAALSFEHKCTKRTGLLTQANTIQCTA